MTRVARQKREQELKQNEAKALLKEELLATIKDHSCVNNAFFDTWTQQRMTPAQFMLFAINHGFFVRSFPDQLATLFNAVPSIEAKTEITKTLFSEMGDGQADKAHSQLFLEFGKAVAKAGGWQDFWKEQIVKLTHAPCDGSTMIPSARALVQGERRLYGDSDPCIALGAQLALEWQAYTMMGKLYELGRQYLPEMTKGENKDRFYEAGEFFYVHMVAEKDHKKESLGAVLPYVHTRADIEKVKEGFVQHLDLIAAHWNGLHAAIMDLRRPRAPFLPVTPYYGRS